MAVQPLSPATDRRLGRPLPCQLSNRTRAHPCAINLWYFDHAVACTLCGINFRFQKVSPTQGQVAHVLLTRPPLGIAASFDLNVLCTPPAFILSQDQTLEQIVLHPTFQSAEICSSLIRSFTFLSMCLEFLQDMLSKNFRDFRTCFFLLVLSSPVVQLSMINHRSYALLRGGAYCDSIIIPHPALFVKRF